MNTQAQNRQQIIRPLTETEKSLDSGFILLTRIFAVAIAFILLCIAFQVAKLAMPAILKFGAYFLVNSTWNPVNDDYGALPQIYGTLVSALIGLLIAVPIGVGTALLLSEKLLPSPIEVIVVFLVELLAAIPSVVYGVWGIFVLIPLIAPVGQWLNTNLGFLPIFSTPPAGPGLFPAGVILAIMTLPIITAISRDALISVPPSLRQAAFGLGATRWETIFKVLIPAAFSGIVSAIMLALGRAMGETMAVTMIIGNSNNISASIFAPSNTIASLLASQFSEASGLQISALMFAALVLFVLTLIVNIFAELIVLRVKRL
ncbi:MAG: phosphate ABC transporter permease subunit PstC [Stigonema ocellatum SAG 48.90 = DSM 106950]|nr:phosphate ABC transporter permease subunit PstC [Stigonema ocellatum SAG 48.90 = DSM 106950]